MAGGEDADRMSFTPDQVRAAQAVIDVVAMPAETPLVRAARAAGKQVITGAEIGTLQALEQFVLYTGITPAPEQVRAAEEFMRSDARD
jgi:shikimate dehydrogenase